MLDAQRVVSARSSRLTWTGPAVTSASLSVLQTGAPSLLQLAPTSTSYFITEGTGLAWTTVGVSGDVILVDDGVALVNDGCSALVGGPYTGKIVLVDRGTCTFAAKTNFALAAGAIGVIFANNVAGTPTTPGGFPYAVPAGMISQADGVTIKALLAVPSTVTVSMLRDPSRRAGTDVFSNLVLLNAPNPVVLGSSVSHFDPQMLPNQLMEPAINTDLTQSVVAPQDMTYALMVDIGWLFGATDEGTE